MSKLIWYDVLKAVAVILIYNFLPDNAPNEAVEQVVNWLLGLVLIESGVRTSKELKRKYFK